MKTVEEMMEALGTLYSPKYGELELRVHHTLTEPTCPTAIVCTEEFEDKNRDGPKPLYFRADADSIEDAIRIVVYAAYITLIERKEKPDTFPFDGPGDPDGTVAAFLASVDKLKAKTAP